MTISPPLIGAQRRSFLGRHGWNMAGLAVFLVVVRAFYGAHTNAILELQDTLQKQVGRIIPRVTLSVVSRETCLW
jgi:hypothetical protein